MNIKVSTIIPMYNSGTTIVDALNSVINQSINIEMEIFVVNDGSTDNSSDVVNEYILNHNDQKITLINKNNGGVSSARNAGIMKADSEWIAFLDADDIWLPQKLEEQINFLKINKDKDISFIGTNRNNEKYPFFKKTKDDLYNLNAKEIILKWYPHTSTTLIKKEVLVNAGFYNEQRSHAEDGDLWLRISEFCKIYVLNKNLVYTGRGKRTFGASGLSANISKMYEGEIFALSSARKRKQLNHIDFLFFYFWLSIKYIRRKIIVGFSPCNLK